jgi:hypothetical protein
MRRLLMICAAACSVACMASVCSAQTLQAPASTTAGEDAAISTTGSGKATFYLVGPGVSRKRDVDLGEKISIQAQDLQKAGDYLAILCAGSCASATFYVSAAKPARLSFLVHPSRVPVSRENAVTGVALPFDRFDNLALAPATVNFELTAGAVPLLSRSISTQDGVAWFRTTSGKSAGAVLVIASLDDFSARRAVQQVASEPCNLKITGERTPKGILVQTEPVHDCAGNPVPDGTIISFTATEAGGKSTVDAPLKQGVARAQIAGSGSAVISVASGVVVGNELRIGAQP